MNYDEKLFENSPPYRYFTTEIWRIDVELRSNKEKINALHKNQKALKVGKRKMVELRRAVKNELQNNKTKD